jgi:hypothetical protein
VQDETVQEPISDLVAEPGEVAGGPPVYCDRSLDLEAQNPATGEFEHQVDLLAALLGPQVVEAGPAGALA